jgi:hypothetical protein
MYKIFLIVLACIGYTTNGYTQSIFKGLNNSNSTFLLGATNARKSQCLYKPSDFNTFPNNGEITKIYYRYGSTGIDTAHSLSPFTIKLGQTNDTVFASGTLFFPGLTTVRFDSVYTIPAGVQGDWFGIDLQTPFIYDSSKTLIVEIQFYNTTAANFGTIGNTNNTQKLISADTAALAQTGFGSTTWQDFGLDYLITTGLSNLHTSNKVILYPNPSKDVITINYLPFKNDGTLSVYDVYGKLVYSKNYNHNSTSESIDISAFKSGIYFLKIGSPNETVIKKLVKN